MMPQSLSVAKDTKWPLQVRAGGPWEALSPNKGTFKFVQEGEKVRCWSMDHLQTSRSSLGCSRKLPVMLCAAHLQKEQWPLPCKPFRSQVTDKRDKGSETSFG